MMKLLVLSLVLSASALLMPKKPGSTRVKGANLKQVLPSTTRNLKSFCTSGNEIQKGAWVALKETEGYQAPVNNGSVQCNPQKMMWEPSDCKLPYHSDDISKRSGRIVFVGDSVTETAARSFAWFYGNLSSTLNDCKYEKQDLQLKVRPQLLKANFSQTQVNDALNYIETTGFRKNHHWWGCKENVAYVPTDAPPPKGTAKAFMFALKNFHSKPLGPDDTIVLNWGHWEKDDLFGQWPEEMSLVMKQYAAWQKEKTAPKLIWREVSPMHWGANTAGAYSKAAFKETQTTEGCSPTGEKLIEHQMTKVGEFPLRNTNMFKTALKSAGLKIDGVNIEFLPIYRGSAERYEDHQPLTKYQKSIGSTIDCTHFCVHGNVQRFWNSALLSVISGMKDKVQEV